MGNNQIGVSNEQMPLPFAARITTGSGKPFPYGEPVTFTARSPSGIDISSQLSNNSDATGNSGAPGLVQTYLTPTDETGVYTVTVHHNTEEISFNSEVVSGVALSFANDNYAPLPQGGLVEDTCYLTITVSGQNQNASTRSECHSPAKRPQMV